MSSTTQMRTLRLAAALAGVVSGLAWSCVEVLAEDADQAEIPSDAVTVTLPQEGSAEHADLALDRYASETGWDTEFVRDGKGNPEALRLFLPPPLLNNLSTSGFGEASLTDKSALVLPLLPEVYRNRFKRIEFKQGVAEKVSFRFVEVGWNTKDAMSDDAYGIIAPHFEIHFYTTAKIPAPPDATCPPEQEACDLPAPDAEIAGRLFDRPDRCFLPDGSIPVAEIATPETGFYNLTGEFKPATGGASAPGSAENPIIIYGSFDGEIISLGVSLTLSALQHAAAESELGERLSWPISQPAAYRFAWWPKTVALEYRPDEDLFALSLEDFSKRSVSGSCG